MLNLELFGVYIFVNSISLLTATYLYIFNCSNNIIILSNLHTEWVCCGKVVRISDLQ